MKVIPKVLQIVASAALIAFVFLEIIVDRIPPRSLTATRMQGLKRRILRDAQAKGVLPVSLKNLLPIEGFDNSLLDGWGREIVFDVSSGTVTLRSFGADGKTGGTGEDADIARSFPTRAADNQWNDESVAWTEDTFLDRKF
jgi:hypothetical protein